MSVEGKTVLRVEEAPTNEYGRAADDELLVRFTDGSALRVAGSSHEPVSLSWGVVSPLEARRFAARGQGRREVERLARLKREAWAALPEEERACREAERRAKLSPLERAVEDNLRQMARGMLEDMNRTSFAGHPVFGGTFTIPVKAAKKGRARRS